MAFWAEEVPEIPTSYPGAEPFTQVGSHGGQSHHRGKPGTTMLCARLFYQCEAWLKREAREGSKKGGWCPHSS